MKRLSLIIALLVLSATVLNAQLDDRVRTHSILALDKAGCSNILNTVDTWNTVWNLLFVQSPVDDGRPLCEDGDLLSIIGFCTDADQKDMQTYQFPLPSAGGDCAYIENYNGRAKSMMGWNDWQRYAKYSNPSCGHSGLFSLVSVAKPYALNELKKDGSVEDRFLTNRTFLLLVTDHHYNGNDFYDEVHTLANAQRENGIYNVVDENKILPLCYAVEQEYFIKYIETYKVASRGYVEIYEFMPLQTYLNLNSVVDYPQTITAKRLKGGKYEIDVDFFHNGNKHYDIKKMEFALASKDVEEPRKVFENKDSVSFDYVVSSKERPEYLNVRAWLRMNDSVYNTTVLTPSVDAPDHLGKNGLNVSVRIKYEEDAKIFGIPMADFIWPSRIEDQYTAAIVVQTVLLVLLPFAVLFLVWLFYRKNRYYVPDNKDITISLRQWHR